MAKNLKKASPAKKSKTHPRSQKPDLLAIFKAVHPLLAQYEPPLHARADYEARYDLWSEKPVSMNGRNYPAIGFAALIIQSSYVGFYFMPIYCSKTVKDKLKPELMACLKGKCCFHLKDCAPNLLSQIKHALKIGFAAYQKQKWV